MGHLKEFFVKIGLWLLAVLIGCVEPIEFDVPPAAAQIVVEGMISDNPGPYTVRVSQAMDLGADSLNPMPVLNAEIRLYDDAGNVEDFTETSPGVYTSGGAIRGEVGRSYHITLKTDDGRIFESEPDVLNPGGEIGDIKFEYESRKVQVGDYELPDDVFNVYVDSRAAGGEENYVRWRFTGTYKVLTYPELNMTLVSGYPYLPYKDPWPCSGYIVTESGFGGGGTLEKVDDCTCCTCWARHYESKPQLSDNQLVSDNQFNNIKVGEVPISNVTFYDKYMVEVEQMSISRKAFEYFKLIRTQKDGASSLFQPPSGEIRGNVKAVNSDTKVVGLFWAASLKKKTAFIQKSDIPYLVTPITYVTEPCYDYYPNSSNEKPQQWEE